MIETRHLFPTLNKRLLDLLNGLVDEQWMKPTVCKKWQVKDIAAHLLDTSLRRLSMGRDRFQMPLPHLESYEELVLHLNELNATWVNAYRRVSPRILVQQIAAAQEELYAYLCELDLQHEAVFPVAWAGEVTSKNWFDIAREYTERWLHQQQIRQAVGAPGLLDPELYRPFLETLMQALPVTYDRFRPEAPVGSSVKVDIVGTAAMSWTVVKKSLHWKFAPASPSPDAQVYIDEQIAWLLFSKGVEPMEARQFWQVMGDHYLGSAALRMVSVMA